MVAPVQVGFYNVVKVLTTLPMAVSSFLLEFQLFCGKYEKSKVYNW